VGELADVRPLLAAADVVVLPSYREGIPRAVMEAAATGRPVVAYDIRGVREVVPQGLGLLVPVGDVDALTAAVRRLVEDDDLRREAGARCAEQVRSSFSEDHVARRLRAVYREMGVLK
jgi:glycosyltransferase involved in cell wall biosynthesis